MKSLVYIRPLVVDDAKISWTWRNDAEIWKFTEFKPDRFISPEMEADWLKRKLLQPYEKRFAICLAESDQYIGNIQLIDIERGAAWYHLFIGEKLFWGKGISQYATRLLLSYAFSELELTTVLLEVHVFNVAARAVYDKIGFIPFATNQKTGFIQMKISKVGFENTLVVS
ncbi:GNAT family protein [Pedobacter gandavensis]|uniref:GNAT family N-acetyltransferase n=1 Tax=Pedobacter gandavensis TaxID=2679963 RepID=UPI00292D99BC|nr:GNAT family protein [Pedobacter gandavensis]